MAAYKHQISSIQNVQKMVKQMHQHWQGFEPLVHTLVGLHLHIILFIVSSLDSLMDLSRRQRVQRGRQVILGHLLIG